MIDQCQLTFFVHVMVSYGTVIGVLVNTSFGSDESEELRPIELLVNMPVTVIQLEVTIGIFFMTESESIQRTWARPTGLGRTGSCRYVDLGLCRFSLAGINITVEKELIHSSKPVVNVGVFLDRDDDVTSSDIDLSNVPVTEGILLVELPHGVVPTSRVQGLDLQVRDPALLL